MKQRDLLSASRNQVMRIAEWAHTNALVLNPIKSQYIILGTKHQIQKIEQAQPLVRIGNEKITRVTEARNLGVIMDEGLRFDVVKTVSRCFYRLKLLYRIRNFIAEPLRRTLCESLVLSNLNYTDVVIGPCLLARSKKLIQKVQNACSRYCCDIPPRAHVTPFINNLRWLKMDGRRQFVYRHNKGGIYNV